MNEIKKNNIMKKDVIHILMACDRNYAPFYGVLLTSLFINNQDSPFHIHWITDDTIPQKVKDKFIRLVSANRSELSLYEIDKSKVTDFPQHGHINYAAYYNLKIADILPADVHRIIYLDGDMIVDGDMRPLWEMDLKGNACAIALAPDWTDPYHAERLGYDPKYGYYNNGTMLYDLDYLREINYSEKAIEYVNTERNNLCMMDQDVANALLYDKILRLPLQYNFQSKFLWKSYWNSYNDDFRQEIIKAAQHPIIIHYSDKRKPWQIENFNRPYTRVWNKYYWKSPWWGLKRIGYIRDWAKRILKPYKTKDNIAEEVKFVLKR